MDQMTKDWLKANVAFAVLELVQSGVITVSVSLGKWWLVALAASTFLGMLVTHLLAGINMIAGRVIVALAQSK